MITNPVFTIGIDCRLINQTGVGVYIRNLLYYLPQDKNISYNLFLLKKSDFPQNIIRNDISIIEAPYKWHSFFEQSKFLHVILRAKPDLMHFTYFSYPILYKKPFIATIHDITPLLFKTGKASIQNNILYVIKNMLFKYVVYKQVRNTKHILVPSYSVKNQLLNTYTFLQPNKITVTYEGLDYRFLKEKKQEKNKKFSNFILYVGNFYPHKNIESLLRAWKQVKTNKKLILLGPEDIFSQRLKQFIAINGIKRVLWIHNATFTERAKYYSTALGLVHPSLSEGFGLPLIEAIHFNCPIIASNIPVFKELLKNSFSFFDPQNVNDIANKISTFLHAKSNLPGCSSAYQNLLKQYSFKAMAEQTYDIYRKYLYE